MLQHYLSYGERIRENLESDLYSKFQCPDRRSSASSTASTGSFESNLSGPRNRLAFSQMSRQCLANTFQRNWTERCPNEPGFDDSLTNLNWLHNVNPTKINEQLSTIPLGYPRDKLAANNYQPRNHYSLNYPSQIPPTNSDSNFFIHSTENNSFDEPDYKNNPNLKPPFSYAILISWAMKELGKPKITLSDIYGWIVDNFAYYRYSDPTWQNSVRHNLSSGKCFEKVPRRKDEPGKGGFWRIKQDYLKTLDTNLSKIKYNPLNHANIPFKTEIPSIVSNGSHINSINMVMNNPRPVNNLPTPVKRSRKSPIRATQENWDSSDYFEKTLSNQTVNLNGNQNLVSSAELILTDDNSMFNNQIDFLSIDNSSCDSYQYLSKCPSNENDISLNSFEDDSIEDLIPSPIIDNEDFKSLVIDNDLEFYPKDNLQDFDMLFGLN